MSPQEPVRRRSAFLQYGDKFTVSETFRAPDSYPVADAEIATDRYAVAIGVGNVDGYLLRCAVIPDANHKRAFLLQDDGIAWHGEGAA